MIAFRRRAAAGVAPARCDLICARWGSEGPRLASAVAIDKQPSAGLPLVDADWRFGVTASTDEVGRVGSTFVQLKVGSCTRWRGMCLRLWCTSAAEGGSLAACGDRRVADC
jgi:hypothetical protein